MKRFLMIAIAIMATTLTDATAASAPVGGEGEALAGADNVWCEDLISFSIMEGTVTRAEVVETGAFTPPVAPGGRPPSAASVARTYGGLPAFCRVVATLRPTNDSNITVEVWMPLSGWNGKYQAVGNGAFSGSIRHSAMAPALASGYATSSTDTGHIGNTAEFGLDHPEKVVDFGWRSLHLMAVLTKEVIAAHYDESLRYSYWNGCSAGGRQAMKMAQAFPEDFDGIVAGAPGQDWSGRAAGALRVATYLESNPAARLSEDDRLLVHAAAISACDAADGVVDGVIDSPQRCDFDPAVLQCEGAKNGSCLTAAQVGTVRMLYTSPVNPSTNREITGLVPGSGAQLDRPRVDQLRTRHRARTLSLSGIRRPQLDDRPIRFRHRYREGGGDRRRDAECPRSRPQAVLRPGRQVARVSRLERRADLTLERNPVLRACGRIRRQCRGSSRLLSSVHGAGHGALPRW